MDELNRKRRYYLKHRDRILKSLKQKRREKKLAKRQTIAFFFAQTMQLITLLCEPNRLGKLLLAVLILSCTGFLITESTRTLTAMEGSGAVGKAILCELVLVGISLLKASTQAGRVLRAIALSGICVLVLLNTLGASVAQFSEEVRGVGALESEIVAVGKSVAQKESLLKRYIETNRITMARHLETELTTLTERLSVLKKDAAGRKSISVLLLGFAITILLRLVVMCANIVFASELGAKWRHEIVPIRANLILVK